MGSKTLLVGSLDPYIVPIYPYISPITPLRGPYYLGPWTRRVTRGAGHQTSPRVDDECHGGVRVIILTAVGSHACHMVQVFIGAVESCRV